MNSILQLVKESVFNKTNPMVVGVKVKQGKISVGEQLIYDGHIIGTVKEIQLNHIHVDEAVEPKFVCIKVEEQSVDKVDFTRDVVEFMT